MLNTNILEHEYTVDEIAGILKLNPAAVYERIAQRRLRARKEGKAYRIPESALLAYVKSTFPTSRAG